jgi:3-hydroxypropanoate dehydrogenase
MRLRIDALEYNSVRPKHMALTPIPLSRERGARFTPLSRGEEGKYSTHFRRIKMSVLTREDQDLIFRNARTHTVWQDKPVDDAVLMQAYDLAKMGPTSANMCPLRIVFVKSKEAKEKLKPALDAGNLDKTMKAPATAILAMDIHFFEKLPKLFPFADARAWFKDLPENILEYMALRNSSLQGAYFIMAARSLGLDCGPMSGFDNAKVDAAFFPGTKIKSNFLCNLGYGDGSKLHPRAPRLSFDEACKIA